MVSLVGTHAKKYPQTARTIKDRKIFLAQTDQLALFISTVAMHNFQASDVISNMSNFANRA